MSQEPTWAGLIPGSVRCTAGLLLGPWVLVWICTCAPGLAWGQGPAITWPEALYNPKPLPKDILLPLPCGGAMAFRWVQADGRVPHQVPPELVDQLAADGRLVIPVGSDQSQDLVLVTREDGEVRQEVLEPVRFVPLLGGSIR